MGLQCVDCNKPLYQISTNYYLCRECLKEIKIRNTDAVYYRITPNGGATKVKTVPLMESELLMLEEYRQKLKAMQNKTNRVSGTGNRRIANKKTGDQTGRY